MLRLVTSEPPVRTAADCAAQSAAARLEVAQRGPGGALLLVRHAVGEAAGRCA